MRPRHVPEREIRFAAKTGFLSRNLWEEFFGTDSKSWRSRKWKSLTETGLFLPHPSTMARNVLVLNPRHQTVKNLVQGQTVAAPFVAQLNHDEFLARILLLLSKANAIAGFVTESEQKRSRPDERGWLERQERLKFPDAVLRVAGPNGESRMALELELTAKSQKRYRNMFETYEARKQVNAIIFLVASPGIFQALTRAMRDAQYQDWKRPVGFGRVDEWSRDPVNAPVRFRDRTTCFGDLARHGFLKETVRTG